MSKQWEKNKKVPIVRVRFPRTLTGNWMMMKMGETENVDLCRRNQVMMESLIITNHILLFNLIFIDNMKRSQKIGKQLILQFHISFAFIILVSCKQRRMEMRSFMYAYVSTYFWMNFPSGIVVILPSLSQLDVVFAS